MILVTFTLSSNKPIRTCLSSLHTVCLANEAWSLLVLSQAEETLRPPLNSFACPVRWDEHGGLVLRDQLLLSIVFFTQRNVYSVAGQTCHGEWTQKLWGVCKGQRRCQEVPVKVPLQDSSINFWIISPASGLQVVWHIQFHWGNRAISLHLKMSFLMKWRISHFITSHPAATMAAWTSDF